MINKVIMAKTSKLIFLGVVLSVILTSFFGDVEARPRRDLVNSSAASAIAVITTSQDESRLKSKPTVITQNSDQKIKLSTESPKLTSFPSAGLKTVLEPIRNKVSFKEATETEALGVILSRKMKRDVQDNNATLLPEHLTTTAPANGTVGPAPAVLVIESTTTHAPETLREVDGNRESDQSTSMIPFTTIPPQLFTTAKEFLMTSVQSETGEDLKKSESGASFISVGQITFILPSLCLVLLSGFSFC